jgi:hypothetical protein
MKNVILCVLLLSNFIIYCQTINIKDKKSKYITGVYFKDIDNIFNEFEGHYRFEEGNQLFEIKFERVEYVSVNNICHTDMLIGGFKYIYDNIIIHDGIDQIGSYGNYFKDFIFFEIIRTGPTGGCMECDENEYSLSGLFRDPYGANSSSVYVRKITHNGQPALHVWINYSITSSHNPIQNSYPIGKFIMLKID